MTILLTCDPEIPVPPSLYGGVERLVDGLAMGYKNEGHEVYLVAHPGSTCRYTQKNYKWPAVHSRGLKNIIKNTMALWRIVKQVKPDVIHSFSRLLYAYPLFITRKVLMIQTYGRKISPKSTFFALKLAGKKLYFTACAAHMLKGLPNQNSFTTVFNFTDVDYFTYDSAIERSHLMFLGRIENIKGTKEAIEAAIQSNYKIIVAGNVQPGHEPWFEQEIRPFLDNPLVQYVGPVNDEQKKYYLQRAKALLFPIKWEEPFGIVLVEALACGTPVIGFNRGSVPEVVNSGKNGFIVNTVDEMVHAIFDVDKLNLKEIRSDAATRFSLSNITRRYLNLFTSVTEISRRDFLK